MYSERHIFRKPSQTPSALLRGLDASVKHTAPVLGKGSRERERDGQAIKNMPIQAGRMQVADGHHVL